MTDVLGTALSWRRQGDRLAVATVVRTWGSAPRPLGSRMVISSRGEVAGSVSGGCVEAAVVDEAQGILQGGNPRLCLFGVSQEQAWSIGLPCGGEIQILITEWDPHLEDLHQARQEGELVALALLAQGPLQGRSALFWPDGRQQGELGPVTSVVCQRLPELWRSQQSTRAALPLGDGSTVDVCLEIHAPRPTLVMVGAVHITEVLVSLARTLGFRTVVVDPRRAFATPERFGHADALIQRWPQDAFRDDITLDGSTYIALLSHDPKLDHPALEAALRSRARYIGALGSKNTHRKRKKALLEAGFSANEIARIHAPIGLPLGGRRVEEIALSVLAEVVSCRYGGGDR